MEQETKTLKIRKWKNPKIEGFKEIGYSASFVRELRKALQWRGGQKVTFLNRENRGTFSKNFHVKKRVSPCAIEIYEDEFLLYNKTGILSAKPSRRGRARRRRQGHFKKQQTFVLKNKPNEKPSHTEKDLKIFDDKISEMKKNFDATHLSNKIEAATNLNEFKRLLLLKIHDEVKSAIRSDLEQLIMAALVKDPKITFFNRGLKNMELLSYDVKAHYNQVKGHLSQVNTTLNSMKKKKPEEKKGFLKKFFK